LRQIRTMAKKSILWEEKIEVERFKELFLDMFKDFPNCRYSGKRVENVIKTEKDRLTLEKYGYLLIEKTDNRNYYGLGPNALSLINSWKTEESTKKTEELTKLSLVLTAVIVVLSLVTIILTCQALELNKKTVELTAAITNKEPSLRILLSPNLNPQFGQKSPFANIWAYNNGLTPLFLEDNYPITFKCEGMGVNFTIGTVKKITSFILNTQLDAKKYDLLLPIDDFAIYSWDIDSAPDNATYGKQKCNYTVEFVDSVSNFKKEFSVAVVPQT